MPDSNPRTAEEARAMVSHVESLFMPWDIEGLLAGFTDDCIVRFGDLPEFRGKAPLERLFRARSERQKNYRLRKELRALMGDTIANYWEGEWEDRVTGAKMAGRGGDLDYARRQNRGVGGRLQHQRGRQTERNGVDLTTSVFAAIVG